MIPRPDLLSFNLTTWSFHILLDVTFFHQIRYLMISGSHAHLSITNMNTLTMDDWAVIIWSRLVCGKWKVESGKWKVEKASYGFNYA